MYSPGVIRALELVSCKHDFKCAARSSCTTNDKRQNDNKSRTKTVSYLQPSHRHTHYSKPYTNLQTMASSTATTPITEVPGTVSPPPSPTLPPVVVMAQLLPSETTSKSYSAVQTTDVVVMATPAVVAAEIEPVTKPGSNSNSNSSTINTTNTTNTSTSTSTTTTRQRSNASCGRP